MTSLEVDEALFPSCRRNPEASEFDMFWVPDQVRHDVLMPFYECINLIPVYITLEKTGPKQMGTYNPPIDYEWNGIRLDIFLEKHKQWVETKGIEGDRAIVTKADLRAIDLEYADLRAAIFEGTDFSDGNLFSITFRGTNLRKASFARANVSWGVLRYADLTEADFSEADLRNTDIRETSLVRAKLSRANLNEVDLIAANLEGADLRQATLELAVLDEVNLKGALLDGADLMLTSLKNADLEGASLIGIINIDITKLVQAKTLYNACLDDDILQAVKEKRPDLLEKP